MALHIPGEGADAHLPLVAGRPSNAGISRETRTRVERITAQLGEKPCGGCGRWPADIVRLDELYGVGACSCGNLIGYRVDIEATRIATPKEKAASALRLAEFGKMTKDIVAQMKKGRA